MSDFIVWLIVGGVIGWVASMLMRTDGEQGILLNVAASVAGAAMAGWLISPLVDAPMSANSSFSLPALLASLLGAVALLAVVNLTRRGR